MGLVLAVVVLLLAMALGAARYGGKWYDRTAGAMAGMTPAKRLQDAIQSRDYAATKLALAQDADVDQPGPTGATFLATAVSWRDAEIVALLADRSHDIDHLDSCGASALHLAVALQEPELVQILVDAGATPAVSCVRGVSTLELALALGNNHIITMLEHCADRDEAASLQALAASCNTSKEAGY